MSTLPEQANNKDESSRLLTVDEIAEQLKVASEQVRCLIRQGQLAAINVGTGSKRPLYRITHQALQDFLNRRFQPGPAIRNRRTKQHRPVRDHFPNLR